MVNLVHSRKKKPLYKNKKNIYLLTKTPHVLFSNFWVHYKFTRNAGLLLRAVFVILLFAPRGAISPKVRGRITADCCQRAQSPVASAASRSPSSRGHQMTSPVSIATEPNDAHPSYDPIIVVEFPASPLLQLPGRSGRSFLLEITIKLFNMYHYD